MIDPLLSNATIKARLLENILEIINSNDEKFLDISIVCEDGSFMWSQFLLAAASDFFAQAMKGVEVTQVVFPDLKVEDVRGILLGLLYNTVPMETAHVNSFVNFLSSPGSSSKKKDSPVQDWSDINYCLDSGIVKSEIDEDLNGEDLDLNQLDQLEKSAFQSALKWSPLPHKLLSTEIQLEESTANPTNMQVDDDDNSWVSGTGHGCGLCEDEFSNYKLLQEHTKLKHNKISISKVNQNKKCGTCLACVSRDIIQDCQVCVYCLDKKRYGGPNKLKKACIKRLCEQSSHAHFAFATKHKPVKEETVLAKEELEGPGEIVNCSFCEYTCTSLRSLREHKKAKHPGEFLAIPQTGDGDLKFMCDFCNDFFMTKDDVLKHVKIHHEDHLETWVNNLRKTMKSERKIMKSEDCKKSNKEYYSKMSNEKKETNNIRRKQSQEYQKRLLKNFYKKDGNLFKCSLCNETFHMLPSFKEHMSTAHKENYTKKLEFICDICGAGFMRKNALTHHSLVHLPPVTCEECDKVFATKMSLIKHKKLRCKSEVPLKFCELCGKGFKVNYDLKKHVSSVHMNNRPCKCTICGNAFKTFTEFKTHCTGKHNMSKDNCKQYLVMINPEVEKNKD